VDEGLWQKFLSGIEANIGPAKFSTWFEPLKYLGSQGKHLRIQVPNRFTREWLSEHYLPLMLQTARELGGPDLMIQFELGGRESANAEAAEASPSLVSGPTPSTAPGPSVVVEESPFNQRLTFDTFVVGPGNRLAHAACLAVAQRPADAYNPLFL
jgi:chromosomal replication initiator protein